jgi:phage terminase small subunit
MARKKKQTKKRQPAKKKVIKKKPIPKKQSPVEEPKEIKLNLKQRKFLKYYLETGNVSQSALKAGYAWRGSGFENLSNPIIQEAYKMLLEKEGLTDNEDIKDLKRLRKAKMTKFFQHEGRIVETEEVDDNATQLKALEMTKRIKGRLVNKIDHSGEIKGEANKIIIIRADDKPKKK